MKPLAALFLLSPVVLLQGCFFLYVPGSMIDKISDTLSGQHGNLCVSEKAVVGGRVQNATGSVSGTVEKIEGPSSRCSDPNPIRALVKLD